MKKLITIFGAISLSFLLMSCTGNTVSEKEDPVKTETAINTPGNIKNGGNLCSNSKDIFYSNPNDGEKLYTIPLASGESKKLLDESVGYLNFIKNTLYFSTVDGLYSLNLADNTKTKLLSSEDFNSKSDDRKKYYHIKDDFIYYFKEITVDPMSMDYVPHYYPKEFYKMPLGGGEKEKILTTGQSLDFNDDKNLVFSDRYTVGTIGDSNEYSILVQDLWNVNVVGVTERFIYADSIHIGKNEGTGIIKIDRTTGKYIGLFKADVKFLLSKKDKVYVSIDGQELLSYSDNGEVTRYENLSEPVKALYEIGDTVVYITKSGEIKSIAEGNTDSSSILPKYMDFSQNYINTFLTDSIQQGYTYDGTLLINKIPYVVLVCSDMGTYLFDFSSGKILFYHTDGVVYNKRGLPINSGSITNLNEISKLPLKETGNDNFKKKAEALNNNDGNFPIVKALESINNWENYGTFYLYEKAIGGLDTYYSAVNQLKQKTGKDYYTFNSVGEVMGESIPIIDKSDGTIYWVGPTGDNPPDGKWHLGIYKKIPTGGIEIIFKAEGIN